MADGVYMQMGVFLASAKSNPDVCSWILGEQGMELTNENNDNICIHGAHQAGRRAMLQGIKQVDQYPGVGLFMVAWQHGVAAVCADHSGSRCNED